MNTEADSSRFAPVQAGNPPDAGLPNTNPHVSGRCGHWAQRERADRFERMMIAAVDDHAGTP